MIQRRSKNLFLIVLACIACNAFAADDVSKSGKSAKVICAALEREGVRMSQYPDATKIRAVTHLDVSRADCERAIEVLRDVVA